MKISDKLLGYLLPVVCLALAAALPACKSSRNAASGESAYPQVHAMPAAPETPAATLSNDFKAMTGAYTPWTDVTVPVKVSVTSPKKISVSGTLAMTYGQALSVSVKMLFIDAGTFYADNDSVIIVSKPMGMYYSESMQRFTAATGMGLSDIQAMLLGQAFAPGKGTLDASDEKLFTLAPDDKIEADGIYGWTITPKKQPAGVEWHFTALSPEDATLASPQLFAIDIEAGSNTIECTYAQSELTVAGVTAAMMQLKGTVKKRSIDLTTTLTPSKASWNSGAMIARPSIPKGAKKVGTEQILNMLNKL